MKPASTLRDRLRESTRDAILDAAASAYNTGGASAVRMEDIAAGAGIAVGTLYNYFRDRQTLVASLLRSRTQVLLDALDAAAVADRQADQLADRPSGAHVTAELQQFVATLVTHWDANRVLLTLMMEDLLQSGADATAMNRQHTVATQLLARAQKLMGRGIEAGLLHPADTGMYAAMLLGMVRGVVVTSVVRGDTGFAHQSDQIVRVFLSGAAV
jgi:AcrR family transcriptional regulator